MAKAFIKLQQLGDEKFSKLLQRLGEGTPAMALAREVQQEWGDFKSIPEKTLTQQLNRLRIAAASGKFGEETAVEVIKTSKPSVKMLENVHVSIVHRLEQLSQEKQARWQMLTQKERLSKKPLKGLLVRAITHAGDSYEQILLNLQKIRFDLGIDELKAPATMRGMRSTTTHPDGSSEQREMFEAVMMAEQILDKRGIPRNIIDADF